MKTWILAATTLALTVGAPLAAQEPHFGLGVTVGVPTGALNSTTYAGGATESYDSTLGLQFTASFPVDRSLAWRLNLSGQTFSGHVDEPGQFRVNTQDAMFSIGADAQIFVGGGNAQRHIGTYLIGGLALDLERFSSSYDDPSYYPDTVTNKSRMGLNVGIGHSMRYIGRWRWNFEATYHKTLSSHDTGAGDPPAADFIRLGAGVVF
ncbi:outer membrane beta-barrel protein [Mesoterricola silvestris]|uniref:Outer membrane protein beta-barrel domain-containing protein n=1 Tax=Mesoterricola silvestris TaxID=2927979 RepID=A0AA48GV02_9BACT|nr:outer membrane beta-barrel protein [Mesoterricola silvestris]BDU74552.1 hypothetical protein METEAL_37260 [Mesoterricola silvestris]